MPENPLDLFRLDGRVAIVTGGSRGLGRAMAKGLAAAGARVVIASRKPDACEAVVREIEAAGGEGLAVPTHVGRTDELERLVEKTVAELGGISIVVNNAANPLGGMLTDSTDLAFEKAYEVNVRAPLTLASRALPHLVASGHGSVINMITVAAFSGGEHMGLYTSSKAALWNLTTVMSKEWGPQGVRVNAIAPGPFATDMMEAASGIPELEELILSSLIIKRMADPSEIVGAALYLASDASSYVTGSVLRVDGGASA